MSQSEPSGPIYGHQLRAARQARGLSQAEVAKALETTQQTVARWERDDVPQPRFRRRIEEFLADDVDGQIIPFPTRAPLPEQPLTTRQAQAVDGLLARSAISVPMSSSDVAAYRALFRILGLPWDD